MRVPAVRQAPVRRWSRWLLFPVLLLLNYLLITVVLPKAPERVEVSYTFFKQQVQADNVVEISTRTDTIQGTFKKPVAYRPNADTPTRTAADFRPEGGLLFTCNGRGSRMFEVADHDATARRYERPRRCR